MPYGNESVYSTEDNDELKTLDNLTCVSSINSCKSDNEYINCQKEFDFYRQKFIAFLAEGTDSDNKIFVKIRMNSKNQEEFKEFLINKKDLPLDFWSCPFGFTIFKNLYPYNNNNI